MNKQGLVLLFLVPLLLTPLAFTSTGSPSYSYLEYKVVYVSQTHSQNYNATSELVETILVNSTLTTSGKYLNEIKVVGTKEVNVTGDFNFSTSHPVEYTVSYYSNASLVKLLTSSNLTQLLNFTKSFTQNFTSNFLNITYHVDYKPVGLVTINFNGGTYVGHEYELTKTYSRDLNFSIMAGGITVKTTGQEETVIKTFTTGVLYSLNSNSTKTTTTTYTFMGTTKTRTVVSTSTLSVTLVSTNVSLGDPGFEAMFLIAHAVRLLAYFFLL